MAWKGLHLSRPARLALKNSQIAVSIDEEPEVRLPLEDVAWIVIDTPQCTITSALISACMAEGIAIVFTDATHTPSGLALPFHRHFKTAEAAQLQVNLGAPLKKRLWQRIVRQKILNQAAALDLFARPGASTLREMAKLVGSGDPENVEARAAREYWGKFWGQFRREDGGDRRNGLLNYGYAVVRSGVARSLVAAGLIPAFGLMHASVSNAFNLADDIVEPFRPFVDALARRTAGETADQRDETETSLADRRAMAQALLENCSVSGETVNLLTACERAALSLVKAMSECETEALSLPVLAP